MKCPACGGESRVLDSRPSSGTIRRSRECRQCRGRFTTYEVFRLNGSARRERAEITNRITKIIEELAQLAEPLEKIERATCVGFADSEE